MDEENIISAETVRIMLGGKWPENVPGYEGFNFEGGGFSFVVEDGLIHPCDSSGLVPGPSFKLVPLPCCLDYPDVEVRVGD